MGQKGQGQETGPLKGHTADYVYFIDPTIIQTIVEQISNFTEHLTLKNEHKW